MILHIVIAFVSTVCFSVIFNSPRHELIFCGITGGLGWGVYKALTDYSPYSDTSAIFFAALLITVLSRIFSVLRRMPLTVFLIPGIIPLVPGAGIYYTMYDLFMNDLGEASIRFIGTMKTAGAISLGIMFVLFLPQKIFTGRRI